MIPSPYIFVMQCTIAPQRYLSDINPRMQTQKIPPSQRRDFPNDMRATTRLFCVTYAAGFANDGDFHLTRVGHFVLNLLCYFVRQVLALGI